MTVGILDIDNSRSIIDVWQGQPAVSGNGSVSFRGGSLSPWSGNGGNIITVHFRAIKEGEAPLIFGNSSFYLANGKGTKVIPQTASATLKIVAVPTTSTPQTYYEETVDDSPPLIKHLSLIPDPFNNNQELLSFLVSDPGSGVKETLVRTRSLLFWSDWVPAQNPTAVPLSVWAVGFKAIDNKGNASEKTIYNFSALLQPGTLGTAALLVIFLLAVGFVVMKIKKVGSRNY